MASRERDLVKIGFDVPGAKRSQPVREGLWAEPVAGGRFRLRNTPMLVDDVSAGDVVFADERDGALVFRSVSIRAGHSTYRMKVMPRRKKAFEARWTRLEELGCAYESSGTFFAIDVPSRADIDAVLALLEAGEEDGVWIFEEAHYGHPPRAE